MSTSSSASSTSMSWRRAKSPGWAAFDLKQRQKGGFELEVDKEPYPPMSSTIKPLHPCQNFVQKNNLPMRSFSSVLTPADKFPNLTDDEDHKTTLATGNSGVTQSNKFTCETDIVQPYTKLKELHRWADESLIEDIMASVDNDVNQASALLTTMASSESFEENKDRGIGESKYIYAEHFPLDHKTLLADKIDSFGESTDLAGLISALEDCLNCKNEKLTDNHASSGNKNSDDAAAHMKVILGHLRSIPVEPELKEDDIYLFHRKDAIKMMRLVSKHSRAATDAYLRGDHFSAQQFSVKAREEWMAAEKLNAKAAKEILSMRNSKNGLWKLDLHGLHAGEAVQALQERLQKLESLELGRPLSPNNKSKRAGILRSGSLKLLSHVEKKLDEQCSSSQQRPTLLHVITGKGTHSKGQAALPNAIRTFLNERGYRYDEARPGLITVRPKFRRH